MSIFEVTTPEGEEKNAERKENNTKYSTTQWVTIIILVFGNFCTGANISLQAPFFPQEAEAKGATPTEYGLMFGIYQLTIFVTAPLTGKLLAHMNPKFLLNAGILAHGLSCTIFGLLDYINETTTFVWCAFIIRAVEGLGSAAAMVAAYGIIVEQFPHNSAKVMATYETFIGIGLIIGPTIGGALYDLGGFGLPFYVVGSALIIEAVAAFLFWPKPGCSNDNGEVQMLRFWLHPSTLVYAANIFSGFNYTIFNEATLEPHIREFHLSGTYLGLLFAVSGATYAAVSPCCGWLCDKKYNVHLLATGGYLLTICSLILISPMKFLNLENGMVTTTIALILMDCGLSAKLVPSFSGCLQDTELRGFPNDRNTYALTASMVTSSISLGGFVGPSLGGYLVESKGYDFAVTVMLLAEFVFFFFLVLYATVGKRLLFGEKKTVELLEMKQNSINGNQSLFK